MTLPMTVNVTAWEQTAAAWLLTYLIHSSLLLSGVWLLTRLGRPRCARLKETLWKASLLGGMLTASLQVLPGFQPLLGNLSLDWFGAPVFGGEESEGFTQRRRDAEEGEKREYQSLPGVHILRRIPWGSASEGAGTVFLRAPSLLGRLQKPSQSDVLPPEQQRLTVHVSLTDQEERLRWSSVVLGMWAAGAGLLLLRLAVMRFRLQRRLKGRRELPGSRMAALLDELRCKAGLPVAVRLTFSGRISSPLVLGGAEICVPRRAEGGLSREEQQSLLAHELAHIARLDSRWLLVSALLSSLFFFQPLNWLARRRLQEEAEYLCDDWAVEQTGKGVPLARCLARVAGWMQARPHTALAPGMAGRPSVFVSRVQRLCQDARPPVGASGWRRWAAALLLPAAVALLAPVISAASPALTDLTAPQAKYYILRMQAGEPSATPEPARKIYRL